MTFRWKALEKNYNFQFESTQYQVYSGRYAHCKLTHCIFYVLAPTLIPFGELLAWIFVGYFGQPLLKF